MNIQRYKRSATHAPAPIVVDRTATHTVFKGCRAMPRTGYSKGFAGQAGDQD
ncbi:MAG: hypothetical protein AAGH76_03525 [Pseudomonadota bacterium]